MSIQGNINAAIATGGVLASVSPKVKSMAETRELESKAKKTATRVKESAVDVSNEPVNKQYKMPKNLAEKDVLYKKGTAEIAKLGEASAAEAENVKALEDIYKQNPNDANYSRLMESKEQSLYNQNRYNSRIESINQRLNSVEEASEQKRKKARERAQRIKKAKLQQQEDFKTLRIGGSEIDINSLGASAKKQLAEGGK